MNAGRFIFSIAVFVLIAAGFSAFGEVTTDRGSTRGDAELRLEARVAELESQVVDLYDQIEAYQSYCENYGDILARNLHTNLESLADRARRGKINKEQAFERINLIQALAGRGEKVAGGLSAMTDTRWPVQGDYAHHRHILDLAGVYCDRLRAYINYPNDPNWSNLQIVRDGLNHAIRDYYTPQRTDDYGVKYD